MKPNTKSKFYSFIVKNVCFEAGDNKKVEKDLSSRYEGLFFDAEVKDPTDSEEENMKKAKQVIMNEIAIDAGLCVVSCELSSDIILDSLDDNEGEEDEEDEEDDAEYDDEEDEDEDEDFEPAPGAPPAPKISK
jgi:hypothetical protein